MTRRFVLTGAPGSGKTVLLEALRSQGCPVVAEAATDVIGRAQERGVARPSEQEDFTESIAGLQHERQEAPVPGGPRVQFFDRSPLCTLALARFLGHPVGPALAEEVDRVVRDEVYQRTVFLVQPLGFVEHTAARRISYAESLEFARVHVRAYTEHGFDLVEIPAGTPAERADTVLARVGQERGRARG